MPATATNVLKAPPISEPVPLQREEGLGRGFLATEFNIYGSSRIGMVTQPEELDESPPDPVAHSQTLGYKVYEFSNHLGNVLTTFSDRKIPTEGTPGLVAYYTSEILSSTDYYPFGFQMPGRVYEGDGYRYGFNGKEQDPETYGTGNIYDYGFRIYNPRIGKFLSVDPLYKDFPMLTTFQYASNNPILNIDLDGLEGTPVTFDPGYGMEPVVTNTQNDQMVAANNRAQQAAVSAIIGPPRKPFDPGKITQTPTPLVSISETMTPEFYNWYRFDPVPTAVAAGGLVVTTVAAAASVVPVATLGFTQGAAAAQALAETGYCAYMASSTSTQFGIGFSAGVAASRMDLSPDISIPGTSATQLAYLAGQLGDYAYKKLTEVITTSPTPAPSTQNTNQERTPESSQQSTPPTSTQQASPNATSSSQSAPASKSTTSKSSPPQSTGYQWAPATQSSSPPTLVSPKGYSVNGF